MRDLILLNQQLKLSARLHRFNHFMTIILHPTLNVIKLQLPLTNNLQQLARSHARQLTLSKRYRQGAHLTLNIQLFNFQKRH